MTDRYSISSLIIAITLTLATSAAFCASIPGYTGKYAMVRVSSIWDDGRKIAIIVEEEPPIHKGQELVVLRGDEIIGLVHITQVGFLNAFGNFYSHKENTWFEKTDRIAVPLEGALPDPIARPGWANVMFSSLATNDLWVVIDSGIVEGVREYGKGRAYRERQYVGDFEVSFVGRHVSYGKLQRKAILPLSLVDDILIRFPDPDKEKKTSKKAKKKKKKHKK